MTTTKTFDLPKVGDLISYEDEANPRRVYVVTETFPAYGLHAMAIDGSGDVSAVSEGRLERAAEIFRNQFPHRRAEIAGWRAEKWLEEGGN